jgi:hypothetical protein
MLWKNCSAVTQQKVQVVSLQNRFSLLRLVTHRESSNTQIRGCHCGRCCGETVLRKSWTARSEVLKVRSLELVDSRQRKLTKTFWPWASPSIRTACKWFTPTNVACGWTRSNCMQRFVRKNFVFVVEDAILAVVSAEVFISPAKADNNNDQTTFVFFEYHPGAHALHAVGT